MMPATAKIFQNPIEMEVKQQKLLLLSQSKNVRLLQLLLVVLLTTHLGICVEAESKEFYDDINPDSDKFLSDPDTTSIMEKLKRSWKSLQGSWGKRSEEPTNIDEYDSSSEWNVNKPNENSRESDSDPEGAQDQDTMKYFVLYASNPTLGSTSTNDFQDLEESSASNVAKKSWKNMNVAWGKRRSAVWNKFRGAWGKREPAWNNLKGMWGKRSTKDWKKLQSAWGKRSQ